MTEHPIDIFDTLIFLAGQLNDGYISPREFRLGLYQWNALAEDSSLNLLAAALGQWASEEKRLEETPNE